MKKLSKHSRITVKLIPDPSEVNQDGLKTVIETFKSRSTEEGRQFKTGTARANKEVRVLRGEDDFQGRSSGVELATSKLVQWAPAPRHGATRKWKCSGTDRRAREGCPGVRVGSVGRVAPGGSADIRYKSLQYGEQKIVLIGKQDFCFADSQSTLKYHICLYIFTTVG